VDLIIIILMNTHSNSFKTYFAKFAFKNYYSIQTQSFYFFSIMANYSVTVPDNKINFFKELIENLGFAEFEETDIPEAHKRILDQRLENYKNNPDSYLDWEDVQKDIEQQL